MTREEAIIRYLRSIGMLVDGRPQYDAKIVPYDTSKRRSREERSARKHRETKRRAAADRKKSNDAIVRKLKEETKK